MNTNKTILSICNRCRDGKEDDLKSRGGQRLLDNFLNRIKNNNSLPNTEQIGKDVVTLPMHPNLTNDEIDYIVKKANLFIDE